MLESRFENLIYRGRIMKQQLVAMLDMQDAMNSRVNAQWRDQNNEWYRAIWVECAELMDHYGWKWWKKQTPDYEQVALELIDIWHFGLSILLQSGATHDEIAEKIAADLLNANDSADLKSDIESFTLITLQTKAFDIPAFGALMKGIDMGFEQLYTGYVGKNVLNFFRQDHGYKEGTYIKVWNGKEDNAHLVEALSELDATSSSFKDDVYAALVSRYPA